MPWKTRGKQRYYYRSVWRDGRGHSQYVGGGEVGRLAAELDQKQQELRTRNSEVRRRWSAIKQDLWAYSRQANYLLRLVFKTWGYYYSHGCWRQRMETHNKLTCEMSREEFEAVVKSANTGDAAALAELREILHNNPEIWQKVGDLGEHAENALIQAAADGNALVAESLRNTWESMRRELAGPRPGVLQRMAAQSVVTAWMELQFANLSHPVPDGDLAHARFQLLRKQTAQSRFDKVVRTWQLVGGQRYSQLRDNMLRVVG